MKLKNFLIFHNIIIIVFISGILFNSIAVLENNCKMPVLSHFNYNYETSTHSFVDSENYDKVNYPYITDILRLGNFSFSIGDIFIFIGGFLFIMSIVYMGFKIEKLRKGYIWK